MKKFFLFLIVVACGPALSVFSDGQKQRAVASDSASNEFSSDGTRVIIYDQSHVSMDHLRCLLSIDSIGCEDIDIFGAHAGDAPKNLTCKRTKDNCIQFGQNSPEYEACLSAAGENMQFSSANLSSAASISASATDIAKYANIDLCALERKKYYALYDYTGYGIVEKTYGQWNRAVAYALGQVDIFNIGAASDDPKAGRYDGISIKFDNTNDSQNLDSCVVARSSLGNCKRLLVGTFGLACIDRNNNWKMDPKYKSPFFSEADIAAAVKKYVFKDQSPTLAETMGEGNLCNPDNVATGRGGALVVFDPAGLVNTEPVSK